MICLLENSPLPGEDSRPRVHLCGREPAGDLAEGQPDLQEDRVHHAAEDRGQNLPGLLQSEEVGETGQDPLFPYLVCELQDETTFIAFSSSFPFSRIDLMNLSLQACAAEAWNAIRATLL